MFKISSLFLFAVLVLGIGAYPPIYSDSNNLSLDSSFIPNAFAQSDSDDDLSDDDDTREDAMDAIEDAREEIAHASNKIVEAENEGKETTLAKEKLSEAEILLAESEANFDVGNYDEAEELAEEAEDLASESRMKYLGKTNEDFNESGAKEDENEIEIEVETEDGITKVKVEVDDEETELKYEGFPEDEIISSIIDLTGLTEDEIKAIWDLKHEDDTDDDSEESKSAKLAEKEARLEEKRKDRLEKQEQRLVEREAKLAEREQMALERAEQLIQKLESRIQQLEQRLQNLVEKLETGEYYGNISDKVAEPKSFILTINGSASQIGNSTNQLPLDGTISLSAQVIKDNAKKLKVDSGEIWIGDQVYDVVFGKARSSSSGPGGENDSLVLIAHTSGIDDEIKTLKLSIDLSSPIDPQSNESLEVSILSPQSKIASEWFLSGDGTLSSGL